MARQTTLNAYKPHGHSVKMDVNVIGSIGSTCGVMSLQLICHIISTGSSIVHAHNLISIYIIHPYHLIE